jgi:hypothetical protein
MPKHHTFNVVLRESELPGRQICADIIRSDGRIARHGMKPEYAEVECALLNEYVKNNWTAERYHAERKIRMAAIT